MLVGLQPIDNQESFVVPEAFQNLIGIHLGQIHSRIVTVACLLYLLAKSTQHLIVKFLESGRSLRAITPAGPRIRLQGESQDRDLPPSRPV